MSVSRTLSLLALALAVHACSSTGPREEARAASRAKADNIARRGYEAGQRDDASVSVQSWLVQGERVPVALTVPGRGSGLPVVVYLPGLGESAEAGSVWHHAWAQAGYAVLSVQALEEDALAWNSPQARALEFKALATQRHDAALLRKRLDRLAAVLDEARRRAADGDVLCSRLDFAHMVVAGYDLGAQAAMSLAGEHDAGSPPHALALARRFQGAIVLSPVVLPGQARRERFEDVGMPVLTVSGPADVDPTGLVAADARSAPFGLMPPGDKFQLMLSGATHATLSGVPETERADERERSRGRTAEAGARRRRRGAAGGDAGTESLEAASRSRAVERRLLPAHGTAEYDAVITTVTVAFLDASVRGRPQARRWLEEQAPDWLRDLGSWRRR